MQYRSLKGMPDILPDEIWKWHYLEEKTREVFRSFNFREIRTPIMEALSLFKRSIGEGTDIVEKEMFTLEDRGGRQLVLRPEVTASVVRAVVEHQVREKKLYYKGPMFRAERPQAGRFRQFYQLGVEYFDNREPAGDVLVIKLLVKLLEALGVRDFTLKLNSLGCAKCRPEYTKLLKKYLAENKVHLCKNCQRRIEKNVVRVFDCKERGCQEKIEDAPKVVGHLCGECRDDFDRVKDALRYEGIVFKLEPRIVRGLDYYERTVFEVTHGALGAQDAIAAGGRYDKLVAEMGGSKTTGACGFAAGSERILVAMEADKAFEREEVLAFLVRDALIYICKLGDSEEVENAAAEIRDTLRGVGRRVEEIEEKPLALRKHLDRANKLGARYVVIAGEEEVAKGEVAVKDMDSGEQTSVKIDGVSDFLKTRR